MPGEAVFNGDGDYIDYDHDTDDHFDNGDDDDDDDDDKDNDDDVTSLKIPVNGTIVPGEGTKASFSSA